MSLTFYLFEMYLIIRVYSLIVLRLQHTHITIHNLIMTFMPISCNI